jgi:hypothetical protein
MKLLTSTASALILLAALGVAWATTYTVLPDGSGDYPTIEAAIDASVNGDVVELGDGTFRGPGNRDVEYSNKLITVRSQSTDPGTCIIDCGGSAAEPHGGFTVDSEAVLEGVTVCNGYNENNMGAVCAWGEATIRNCVIRNNSSAMGGAGAYCADSATFDHCWFIENVSAYGAGAVRVGNESSPRFVSCYFLNNTGLACTVNSYAEFTSCVFSGGSLGGWGAVGSIFEGVDMVGCTITNFDPSPTGGVICAELGSHVVIENTLIAWNRTQVTVYCTGWSAVTLTCSNMYGNTGGDWTDCCWGQLGLNGNICLDPQFCSASPSEDLDWSIHSESPCAPAQSGCGLIGAESVGCGPTPAEARTWGGVKLLFRK